MHEQFKQILLETIQDLKNHPDGVDGVAFISSFDEEPDWEVVLAFRPKTNKIDDIPPTTTLQ